MNNECIISTLYRPTVHALFPLTGYPLPVFHYSVQLIFNQQRFVSLNVSCDLLHFHIRSLHVRINNVVLIMYMFFALHTTKKIRMSYSIKQEFINKKTKLCSSDKIHRCIAIRRYYIRAYIASYNKLMK